MHSYYKSINTQKLLCRITKQNLPPYMSAHSSYQHRHTCFTRPSAGNNPISQDLQQRNVPISWDHQQGHHHKNALVSQDHQQKYVPLSQDHCHKNIPVSQDHKQKCIPGYQDHHKENVNILQDFQLRYTQRRSAKPTFTQHHCHSKGPNQQPDAPVCNPITGPQPETTTDSYSN